MLKQILFSCLLILFVTSLKSQSVGIGTTSPSVNAILDLKSTSKGFLVPRLTNSQMNSLTPIGAENGMLIFNINSQSFQYYSGSQWNVLGSKWSENSFGIYNNTQNVGIGSSAFSNTQLSVENSDNQYALKLLNEFSGLSTKYSLQVTTGDENTNSVTYGIQNLVTVNSANTKSIFGDYTILNASSASGTLYGTYSSILSTGTGNKYAFYGVAPDEENSYAGYFAGDTYVKENMGIGVENPAHKLDIENPSKIGINLVNTSASADTVIGINNVLEGNGSGTRIGSFNRVFLPNNYDRAAYGVFGVVQNAGAGSYVGVYGQANGSGNTGVQGTSNGTGIGVKGINTNFNGWAGFFDGRTYVDRQLNIGDKVLIEPTGWSQGGHIEMYDDDGTPTIQINANQTVNQGSEIKMFNDEGDLTIEIDADYTTDGKGRIITGELEITGGSDLAEHFDINADKVTDIKPGLLVSIDPSSNGKLNLCTEAYDKKVAGVISGANGVKPGMLMGQKASIADGAYPIALTGRVYVMADASKSAIKPGDLLCSSSIPGYAMKAKNNRKAKGAVIGKAMTALDAGQGYVLILVNLQ